MINVCNFILPAPSAVRNLTASPNDTRVLISWREPDTPNGMVTYSVEVMERNLLTNENITIANEGVVTELELSVNYTVEPYSEYTVTVTSRTRAGEGEPATFLFQTPEEGILSTYNA